MFDSVVPTCWIRTAAGQLLRADHLVALNIDSYSDSVGRYSLTGRFLGSERFVELSSGNSEAFKTDAAYVLALALAQRSGIPGVLDLRDETDGATSVVNGFVPFDSMPASYRVTWDD